MFFNEKSKNSLSSYNSVTDPFFREKSKSTITNAIGNLYKKVKKEFHYYYIIFKNFFNWGTPPETLILHLHLKDLSLARKKINSEITHLESSIRSLRQLNKLNDPQKKELQIFEMKLNELKTEQKNLQKQIDTYLVELPVLPSRIQNLKTDGEQIAKNLQVIKEKTQLVREISLFLENLPLDNIPLVKDLIKEKVEGLKNKTSLIPQNDFHSHETILKGMFSEDPNTFDSHLSSVKTLYKTLVKTYEEEIKVNQTIKIPQLHHAISVLEGRKVRIENMKKILN
jgi:chromosome segregation ATPase